MESDGRRSQRPLIMGVALAGVAVLLAAGIAWAVWGSAARTGGAESSTAAPATTASASVPAGDRTITVQAAGRTRTMIVHVPKGPAKGPMPLVLVFHGAGDTALSTAAGTDFESVADQRGMVVAFLQGYQNTWNEGAGHTPAEVAGIDDVAFARVALQRIQGMVPIDRQRVAAVGFSNGALLTDLLGCRLADAVRLIVPVSGPLPVSVSQSCRPSRPVSVLEVHGTADDAIPYGGGPFAGVGGGTTVLSAPDAVARWAALDGCGSRASTTPDAGGIRITSYTGCPPGVSVRLRTVEGGGHAWPADIGELVAEALGT
ncbi:PHB depolymerase family esterase [Humibacter antri]